MKNLVLTCIKTALPLALVIGAVVFAPLVYGQQPTGEYQPLTGIPGVDPNNLNLVGYVNALFLLSIALGGILAVIRITLAGFKYMMTDVVSTKGSAKDDIYSSLLGLGILLATFIVLYTINPQLTNLNILSGADPIQQSTPVRSTATGGTGANATTCPAEQTYVATNSGGICKDTQPTSNTGGTAQLCPSGQRDIPAIGISPSSSFRPSGTFEYPDSPGAYYSCIPAQ